MADRLARAISLELDQLLDDGGDWSADTVARVRPWVQKVRLYSVNGVPRPRTPRAWQAVFADRLYAASNPWQRRGPFWRPELTGEPRARALRMLARLAELALGGSRPAASG